VGVVPGLDRKEHLMESVNAERVLAELVRSGSGSVWALSGRLHLAPGTVRRILQALRQQGYVYRSDAMDGRSAVWAITPRGKARVRQ